MLGWCNTCGLLVRVFHMVVTIAFLNPDREPFGIDLPRRHAQLGMDMRHAGSRLGHQILETQEIQALLHVLG